MPSEIEGMMRRLLRQDEAEEQEKPTSLQDLAQAMELRRRFAAAQVKHDLKPGDLCREKAGLESFMPPRLVLFWRWLDTRSYFDRCAIADFVKGHMTANADCIAAFLGDKGQILFDPIDSQRLEPLPPGVLDEEQPQAQTPPEEL